MNVFELIRLVLDREYDLIPGDPATRDARIMEELAGLTRDYRRLTDGNVAGPNYASALTRFAYIFKYTTCHANMVADVVAAVPVLAAMFARTGWVDVACIGGGPGSDFLGVVKHMIHTGSKANLKAYLLDKEAAWGDSWTNVERQADGLKFHLSTTMQTLDVLEQQTWRQQTRYRDSQLFTFVYFISELWRLQNQASAYFADLLHAARPGSFFLFVDNNDSRFYDYFDDLAASSGLIRIHGGEGSFSLNYDEQKAALQLYINKFGHNPKLQSSVAVRVYTKPAT